MHSPFFLGEQLKTAIAAGALAAVAAIVDECEQAGSSRFAGVFAPDHLDDESSLPLFEAVRTGQGAIVSLLLEQGCDLEQRDKIGATPLYQDTQAEDLNNASADSYYHEETILHRVLDSFRRYEPDGKDAPKVTLRQCVMT